MITIIKVAGLFLLSMGMLVAGYFMGYAERKVDEEREKRDNIDI